MAYYKLPLNADSPIPQHQLIQNIKSDGDEVIQMSDGLCIKSDKPSDRLIARLKEQGIDQSKLQPLDHNSKDLSPDVLAFMGRALL